MLLFAYGSNLASSEMEECGPEARLVAVARLPGFALARTRRSLRWDGGVVDLVARSGSEVWGALYELPDQALARLDVKEGAGFAYLRRAVLVEWPGGTGQAVAYEVIAKEEDVPPATAAYRDVVMRGACERGLPPEWIETLASVLGRPE